MAEAPSHDEDRYALVSSLYGSGTIACWYLTAVSVLLSWTLHPHKRKSGSIDVDLIVTLTLPAVAAGHLLWQLLRFQEQSYVDILAMNDSELWQRIQAVAAIEAPFNVVETFMSMSIIFFVVAVWMSCVCRASAVGIIGLLCFAVECYFYFSDARRLGLEYQRAATMMDIPAFSRYFVAHFAWLVISMLVVLGVCAFIASALASLLLRSRHGASSGPHDSPNETDNFRFVAHADRSGKFLRSMALVGQFFLPFIFIASITPTTIHAGNYFRPDASPPRLRPGGIKGVLLRFGGDYFPRTSCSLTDLDQAVALGTGATILAFQVYSIASAHVAIWKRGRATHSGQHRDDPIELHRRA